MIHFHENDLVNRIVDFCYCKRNRCLSKRFGRINAEKPAFDRLAEKAVAFLFPQPIKLWDIY
ncbi:hypothetical protein [Planococcus glaciei]|uniref:hypothetical protein n=1 Tax=Planococcus glaciei TaxID=459472 RepID=UPI000945A228|nr:hypothetical protein [Planococcus glaciei]